MKGFLIILIGIFTLISCKKDGCTDTSATNFQEEANKDDGSCTYESSEFTGTYFVNDFITGGMNVEDTSYRTYSIIITQNIEEPHLINIKYFADLMNPTSSATAVASVNSSYFYIDNQSPITKGDWYDNYLFQPSEGWISGDSIYFDFAYSNSFGEVFWGEGSGHR